MLLALSVLRLFVFVFVIAVDFVAHGWRLAVRLFTVPMATTATAAAAAKLATTPTHSGRLKS